MKNIKSTITNKNVLKGAFWNMAGLILAAFLITACSPKGDDHATDDTNMPAAAGEQAMNEGAMGADNTVFKKAGCLACHHPTKDQLTKGLGPSVAMISEAYAGDKAALLEFFQNGTQQTAKIAPDKFSIMKTQLPQIQKLSAEDQDALANYLLSL